MVQADYAEVSLRPLASESLDSVAAGPSAIGPEAAKAGLRLTPSSVDLVEGGDPATYRVVLRKQPSAPVIVSISPDDQTEVSLAVLIFDASQWDQPQEVSVWARDDGVVEEPQHSSTIDHYTASTDAKYNGLDPEVLTATIKDNDTAGIRANPTNLTVVEPDGSALLRLTLTSPPGAGVTVPLSASNAECTVAPQSILLDQDNWDSGAEATVSARDDSVQDGEQTCLIQGGPSTSNDPVYNGLAPNVVTVTVLDDEGRWRALLPQVFRRWPPLPATPVLRAIDNADGDGAYTVQWDAAALAEAYVLEEASMPTFATARQRYDGPATLFAVEGQGAARLYYRVKATNNWGDSTWSEVQRVDILWEAEPNDNAPGQANGPLASGLVYSGSFGSGQDVKDYYFFDLTGRGMVKVWLTNVPGGRNYDLVLRDNELGTQPGWYSAELGNQDEFLEATVPAGRYYIQVYNTSGLSSSQPYHLQLQY